MPTDVSTESLEAQSSLFRLPEGRFQTSSTFLMCCLNLFAFHIQPRHPEKNDEATLEFLPQNQGVLNRQNLVE